jgi:tetratricopeptide (TPR) repeat protein
MCKGVDDIYNLQFTEAKDIYRKISAAYPAHPMTYLYRGMITYWENYPLIPTSPARKSFEKDMRYAIELCEKEPHPKDAAEYLISNLGGRGMLLLFYADNELSMEVFSIASSTYQYIKESFNHTNSYADFYFFTGLYNYYREAYPEAHPVYKPLTILFPKGDREKGLKELQIAAKNAIVLKAEAYSFLSGIYISFEKNFQQASQYSKALNELYPHNLQYMVVYAKNLLLAKRYNEAESMIRSSCTKSNNAFFQAQLSILSGILYEKKYNDLKQAKTLYTKGITDIAPFGVFGNEFAAYGYFGLSRISETNGDKHYKRVYRKQAMDMADFKDVNFDK